MPDLASIRLAHRHKVLGAAAAALATATALVPSIAWSAAPRKDAGYQGVTSQRNGPLSLPVALRVSKDAKSIVRLDIQWTSKCSVPAVRSALGGLSVTRNRTISKSGSFGDKTVSTQAFGDATKGTFTTQLEGKFTKRTLARGTFQVTVVIDDASGQRVDGCDSGKIAWSARD